MLPLPELTQRYAFARLLHTVIVGYRKDPLLDQKRFEAARTETLLLMFVLEVDELFKLCCSCCADIGTSSPNNTMVLSIQLVSGLEVHRYIMCQGTKIVVLPKRLCPFAVTPTPM